MTRSHHPVTRSGFLRLGALSGLAAVSLPSPARAASPAPAPQGDDVAYLQFGATGELLCLSLYAAALRLPGLSGGERRRFTALRAADRAHYARLAAVLGEEAPQFGDFAIRLPRGRKATRARILATALDLEALISGVYLSGATAAEDPATRALLGRLLSADAQHEAELRVLAGRPAAPTGLPFPITLEDAAPRLDAFLGDAYPAA